jgi:hypothetical protein
MITNENTGKDATKSEKYTENINDEKNLNKENEENSIPQRDKFAAFRKGLKEHDINDDDSFLNRPPYHQKGIGGNKSVGIDGQWKHDLNQEVLI